MAEPSRNRLAKRVLLIGWDAADWKVITPLMDAGKMPALKSLVERGVMGNLSTLAPPFSPMLWTSIATGHTADRHGILHFVQPADDGSQFTPVLNSSRRVKALWNILSQSGMRSNVVGWWPSHPVEPIQGAMVSNFFHPATAPIFEPWVAPPGTVHPPELEDVLASYRVHPAELTANHLLPFLPQLADVDQDNDARVLSVAKILADAATVHAVSTYLMAETEWDLTAVYFDAIDHFSHGFMRYRPPQMANVSDDDHRLYQNVVDAAYQYHDMMLERQLAIAGPDCTVILISDHGFHSDHLRPEVVPRHVPAGAAAEHRSFGIVCMAGPGIRVDERINGAGLLNIAPTVLALLGLPIGEDMWSPPLVQAFKEPLAFETIPSWENVEGDSGRLDADATAIDPWSQQEAMRQLVALGYIDQDTSGSSGAEAAVRDSEFNLGRVYASTGRPEEAIPHLEAAHATKSPHRDYYALGLIQAYLDAGRTDDASNLAALCQAEGTRFETELLLARADIESQVGRPSASLALLDELASQAAEYPETLLKRANLLVRLQRTAEASDVYEQVLALDPDNARAHHGVAIVRISEKRYEEAADAALAAVSRLYYFPDAHFHLGVAMTRLGWAERAEQAFKVAVDQRPTFALAHRWLARIYQDYLKDRRSFERHWAICQHLEALQTKSKSTDAP